MDTTENEPLEPEECEHEDHEDGCCLICGESVGMSYNYEHDSGDLER